MYRLEVRAVTMGQTERLPFAFPHRCFEMSLKIQAALEALTEADPWGNEDPKSATRLVAYRVLRGLVTEAKKDLSPASDTYDSLLKEVLGGVHYDSAEWRHSTWGRAAFWRENTFLAEEPVPSSDFTGSEIGVFRTRMINFSRNLENLGLYFLRVLQAQGKIPFGEVTIQVGPTTPGA